jgi:hypothetical protein
MSFMLTTEQIKNQTKTVTRRLGWWFLKPGDLLWACEKCMGLKKGEQIKKLCLVRVVSVSKEPLSRIDAEDCIKEGFPEMEPADFVKMLLGENLSLRVQFGPFSNTVRKWRQNGNSDMLIAQYIDVNRIEFEYVKYDALGYIIE